MKIHYAMRAFTLIETILYLALFNVIFVAVIGFTIALTQNNRMSEYRNAIDKDAILVSEHLQDTMSSANTIDSINSVYTQDNGKIRVNIVSGYREYYLDNGTLKVTNGTQSYDLTSSLVSASRLYIETVVSNAGTQTGAKITIEFVAKKYPSVTKQISSYYDFR
jgi:competence protein ComGF